MAKTPTEDEEACPLCPAGGPSAIANDRSRDAAGDDPNADVADLVWIACSKCQTWFHSCCLLLADSSVRDTIPKGVRDEIETNHKGEAPFFDWTIWINKW